MTVYRSSLQIVARILSLVNRSARKTHIMYGANLSYRLLNRYLGKVLGAGLARLGDDGWYEITEKGCMFLDRCNGYLENNEDIGKHVEKVESTKEELESLLST